MLTGENSFFKIYITAFSVSLDPINLHYGFMPAKVHTRRWETSTSYMKICCLLLEVEQGKILSNFSLLYRFLRSLLSLPPFPGCLKIQARCKLKLFLCFHEKQNRDRAKQGERDRMGRWRCVACFGLDNKSSIAIKINPWAIKIKEKEAAKN